MKKLFINALLLALVFTHANVFGGDERLEKCRTITERLGRLEALREYGGSAKKMDSWKRQINKQRDEYSRLNCGEFWRELD